MIQRTAIVLFLFLMAYLPCLAQEVEFEIPSEISIVPGQLSVVFNEEVTEEKARALIESMQYEILELTFSRLQIIGHTDSAVSDQILNRLNNEKGIDSVVRYTGAEALQGGNITIQDGPTAFMIAATFQDGVKQSRAKRILKKHVRLNAARTVAAQKEIIIQVGDNDEEAFDILQTQKGVRWVTYVGKSGDF